MSDLFGGSGLGGLLGGLFGGAAGAADASANNANAGHENMTTTAQPWGAASPYLQGLMQMAYGSLGPGSASWGQLTPQGQGMAAYGGASGPGVPPGAPGAPAAPGAQRYDSYGYPIDPPGGPIGDISRGYPQHGGPWTVPESTTASYPAMPGAAAGGASPPSGAPAAGGGGGGGAPAGSGGFNGTSPQSQQAINQLLGIAGQGGGPLQGEETSFAGQYLAGQDPNAYRQATYGADQAAAQGNPQLQAFLNELGQGQMPGSPGAQGLPPGSSSPYTMGVGGGGGGFAQMAGPSPTYAAAPISNENDFIQGILAQGQQKYQANPALQQMEDAATAGIKQQMATQTIPGITSASVGSGLMGGSAWQDAMAKAANQETTAVGNAVAPLAYQGYSDQMARQMQAATIGSQLNENTATNNASMANASLAARSSAGAAMGSASLQYQLGMAQLAQQGQLARMNTMLSGIGMNQQNQQYDLGQMGTLSDAYGQQQLGAGQLGASVESIPAQQMAMAAQAAQAGVGGQNAYMASQNQLRAALAQASAQRSVGMAQVGAEQARTNLSQQEFYDPMTRMGDVSNIIGGLSRGYGSTNTQGTNYTNLPMQNVAGQGLAGLLGGMNMGSQLGNLLGGMGGGGGGGTPGGAGYNNFPSQGGFVGPTDPNAPQDLSGASGAYGTPGYGVLQDPSSYYNSDPSGGYYNFDPTGGT